MQQSISQINTPIPAPALNQLNNLESETSNQLPITAGEQPSTIKKLSIIIPAYNEEKYITLILDRINEVKLLRNIEKEVIIVNDCSTDKTEAVILNYINNSTNLTINYFKYIK